MLIELVRFLLLQVFLIIMLAVITWNQQLPSTERQFCSRQRSSIVHDVLKEKFWPLYDYHGVSVPKSCPFHRDRDTLFWPLPKATESENESSAWICPVCGIDFVSDEKVIHHWDEIHTPTTLSSDEDSVCLADFCELFRCDIRESTSSPRSLREDATRNLMSFLPSFSRTDCDSAEFDSLRTKCGRVMQQCTDELFVMNEPVANSILSKLDSQICSYLTCERYTEDLDYSSRKVPVFLFTLFAIVTATGFTLCYYLLWPFVQKPILKSDSHRADNNQHKLKLSFKPHKLKLTNGGFFGNIFEFNRDTSVEQDPDFARKPYTINSIAEEDEEIETPSEIEAAHRSYPIVRRSNSHQHREFSPVMALNRRTSASSSRMREVCIEDLPMTTCARFVQPLKHSYSEQFVVRRRHRSPDDGGYRRAPPLMPISRSYSHTQFRQIPSSSSRAGSSTRSIRTAPVRQYSLEEDRTWDQRSAHSHSSLSVRSNLSGPAPRTAPMNFDPSLNGRYPTSRHVSNSSLSYSSNPATNTSATHHQHPLYSHQPQQSSHHSHHSHHSLPHHHGAPPPQSSSNSHCVSNPNIVDHHSTPYQHPSSSHSSHYNSQQLPPQPAEPTVHHSSHHPPALQPQFHSASSAHSHHRPLPHHPHQPSQAHQHYPSSSRSDRMI